MAECAKVVSYGIDASRRGSGTQHLRRVSLLCAVLGASALAWLAVFLAIPPAQQNFPLGDDWAFSRSFEDLATGHGLNYRQFAAMPQLGQWLWAWPFFKLFGPSLFALRLSTIVLGWLGLIAVFDLFCQEGLSPGRSAFLVATLGLNPLWFALQGTFMTDVPTFAFCFMALASYGRALRQGTRWLLVAVLCAVLAALTRQNSIIVPLVALLCSRRRLDSAWLACVAIPLLTAVATHFWFVGRADTLAPSFAPRAPAMALISPFLILHTCGLMCLPAIALRSFRHSARSLLICIAAMFIMALYWAAHNDVIPSFDKSRYYPYTIPILGPSGPFAGHFQVGIGAPLLPESARVVLTILGCIGGGYLLAGISEAIQSHEPFGMTLWFAIFQAALLFFVQGFYDRYFLVLMPSALVLMSGFRSSAPARPGPRLVAGILLLGGAALAVCTVHDWMSWNRARWDVGRRALARHIDPSDIEGGFEWDGWYTPVTPQAPEPVMPDHALLLRYTASNFYNVRGRFAIGFPRYAASDWAEPIPEVVIRDREAFSLWSRPGVSQMLFLEAVSGLPLQAIVK
jgi:hypothetical protein